jgi:hypothetical protein
VVVLCDSVALNHHEECQEDSAIMMSVRNRTLLKIERNLDECSVGSLVDRSQVISRAGVLGVVSISLFDHQESVCVCIQHSHLIKLHPLLQGHVLTVYHVVSLELVLVS